VLTLIGTLWYEPNSDGAWWFASEVLPLVRRELPDAELRLVGRTDAKLDGIERCPGVVVRGQVPEVAPELAASTVSVVPLRSGGGTRLKILEAFAYGVPVVTTTVGCEGLDVVDGEHLLVADDPAAFAAACVRLVRERDLADRLTRAGFDLVRSRYAWSELRPRISALAAGVAAGDRPPSTAQASRTSQP
jgi:glycosyltransferase involved in cell wall biosynthesis